jgi:hypothetical protein
MIRLRLSESQSHFQVDCDLMEGDNSLIAVCKVILSPSTQVVV